MKISLIVILLISISACSKAADPTVGTPAPTPDKIVAATSAPTQQTSLRSIDVDALAARMKKHQDLYKQLRDESLSVYAKTHTVASQYDKPAQTAIRLAAYLWVWEDYYQEGLWQTYGDYSKQCMPTQPSVSGAADPLISVFDDIRYFWSRDYHSTASDNVAAIKERADTLEKSDYPACFKYFAYANLIKNLTDAKHYEKNANGLGQSYGLLPELENKAAKWYGELIKQHCPDDIMFARGKALIFGLRDDEEELNSLWADFTKVFDQITPASPLRVPVEGRYYIDSAWNARGSGWSNKVTETGWKLFNERLGKASDILETAYSSSECKALIAEDMLTVELGQGQGRERMEMWFQRAIADDPGNYSAYQAKLKYLQPRWYGNAQEAWNFGLECVKSQNWSAKLPMVLVEEAEWIADSHPKVYSIPEVWDPLETVFRAYLVHYPNSTIYRSKFAKYAALGAHWKVAKEQFDILGNDWDRGSFENNEYQTLLQSAITNSK